jgi:hypothetical protein
MLGTKSVRMNMIHSVAIALVAALLVGCGHQVVVIDFDLSARTSSDGVQTTRTTTRDLLTTGSSGQRHLIQGDGWTWSLRLSIVGFGGEFTNTGPRTICIQFMNGQIVANSISSGPPWPTTGAYFLEDGRWQIIGKSHGYGPVVKLVERCVQPGKKLAHTLYFDTKQLSGENTLFGPRERIETAIPSRTLTVTIPLRSEERVEIVRVDFVANSARFETAYW